MEVPFELQIAAAVPAGEAEAGVHFRHLVISILGVTVGVMALIIALALMTGLQQEDTRPHPRFEPAHVRMEDRRHH